MPLEHQQSLTVERVIEETVEDVRSYYLGQALRSLLTYQKGDGEKLTAAAGYIQKLTNIEQQVLHAVRAAAPVTAIK